MRLDWERRDEALSIVEAMVPGGRRGFGQCRVGAVVDRLGTVVAGLVFHDWSPEGETVEITAAAIDPRWFTRGVIEAALGYCFSFAQAVVVRTHEGNAPARRIWRALGASEHIIPRLGGRNQALAVYVLTDDAWRASKWRRHGKT